MARKIRAKKEESSPKAKKTPIQESESEEEVPIKKRSKPEKKTVKHDSDSESEDKRKKPTKKITKKAPKKSDSDSDSDQVQASPKKRTSPKKAGKETITKKSKKEEISQKYFVLPKDTLVTIFSYLDSPSLKKAKKAFPEWKAILDDDKVWKQLTLTRYPRIQKLSLQFNKKISSWEDFYEFRLLRDDLIKNTIDASKFDQSAFDFDQFLKEVTKAKGYRQLAGYFPNKDFKKGELAILADTVLYDVVNIREERDSSVPYDSFTVGGYISNLEGKLVSWSYKHFVSFSGGEAYNNEGPTITIGKSSVLLDDGEDIAGFVKKAYKELKLKKTTLSDFLEFVCLYMKPAASCPDNEAIDNVKEELE